MNVIDTKSINKTFTLDEETIKKLEEQAKLNHLSRSAFLRFLIWDYDRKVMTKLISS